MSLRTLELKNVRVYDSISFAFHPTLNVITGNNAQGKTTVLESIYLLSYTKSHRTHNDKEIIRHSKDFAKVAGQATDKHYELIVSETGKKVKVNGGALNKLSAFVGDLSVVMFAPEDIELIKGAPKLRRQFMNMQGSHQNQALLGELSRYQTVLKERNQRIKQISTADALKTDGLFQVLTQRLATSAKIIMTHRKSFLSDLSDRLTPIYQAIANDGLHPVIHYHPAMTAQDMAEQFKQSIERDFQTKTTNVGPHRDEFIIRQQTDDFKTHASQGQFRTLALAIKLALVSWMKAAHDVQPIVLLDDVFSELDKFRQNALLRHLDKETQVFITTTDLNLIKRENLTNYTHFIIDEGKVQVNVHE